MPTENAIWFPFWYGSDQPIHVGQLDDFNFFKHAPEHVAHEGLLVFYHGGWQESCRDQFDSLRRRILSIWHPEFGPIQSIDTGGLDYTMTLANGRIQKIEAEESPGLAYELQRPITDWRIYVEIEPA